MNYVGSCGLHAFIRQLTDDVQERNGYTMRFTNGLLNQEGMMNNLIWLVGAVVIVLVILGFFGLR